MRRNLILLAFLVANARLFAATAPDFTITDSDGNVRHLYADFINQGKAVVLEIFFVNCPPCATHAPYWQSLYENTKAQHPGQVEFIMLSDKNADNNSAVAQYKLSKGLTMPAAGSNGGSLTAVQPYESGLFGLFYGTPTFVLIKPGSGEMVYDVRGNSAPATMDSLSQAIAQLFLPKCLAKTYQGDTLQNYSMNVAVPGGASMNYLVTNGQYSLENFLGLPSLPFYIAKPSKNDNPLNGVSTFDLVQINKHILGIELFPEPWQLIAADANGSGTITTFDIVELRKLILGVYDSLPSVPSWVFSPDQDTLSPLECPAFKAIKKGDVNGNASAAGVNAAAEDRDAPEWALLLENRLLEAGKTYRLHFRAGISGQWQGMQAAIRFDPGVLEVRSVESGALPGFDAEAWRQAPGRVSISWFQAQAVDLTAYEPVLTLDVRVLQDTWARDALTLEKSPLQPEAYDAAGARYRLERRMAEVPADAAIWPNPSSGYFVLRMEHTGSANAVLQLMDVQGKSVYRQPVSLADGQNQIEVRPGPLPAGVYGVWLDRQWMGKLFSQN